MAFLLVKVAKKQEAARRFSVHKCSRRCERERM